MKKKTKLYRDISVKNNSPLNESKVDDVGTVLYIRMKKARQDYVEEIEELHFIEKRILEAKSNHEDIKTLKIDRNVRSFKCKFKKEEFKAANRLYHKYMGFMRQLDQSTVNNSKSVSLWVMSPKERFYN